MVEYSHENIQTIQSEKTYPRLKKMIDLKLDPQNIELKKNNKSMGSFKVKMHIHPMLETLIIPIKISQD
jgi:ribosomal protein L9